MLPIRDSLQSESHTQTECEGIEKDIPCKWQQQESWGSNTHIKVDFKTMSIIKDKERHHIMIKVSIEEEDTTFINTYAPNIGAHKYIKQILTEIKGEIDNNTRTTADLNNTLTSMDRSSTQKIIKETVALNDTFDQ